MVKVGGINEQPVDLPLTGKTTIKSVTKNRNAFLTGFGQPVQQNLILFFFNIVTLRAII